MEDDPDPTMQGRRGEHLVSAATAVDIAKRVYADYYGSEEAAKDEPFTASEKGENWIVRGSRKIGVFRRGQPPEGPLIMKISKIDAQILSFCFQIKLSD